MVSGRGSMVSGRGSTLCLAASGWGSHPIMHNVHAHMHKQAYRLSSMYVSNDNDITSGTTDVTRHSPSSFREVLLPTPVQLVYHNFIK